MTANFLFVAIVLIILLGFILDRVLSLLNQKSWKPEIPAEMLGFYDEEKYKKSHDYEKARGTFNVWSSLFSLVLILLMLFFNGFAYLDAWVRDITENQYLMPLLYFGILFFISDILSLPFSVYSTFVIEEKFGFNKMTPFIFITDKLKGMLLAVILGGAILCLFIWFYSTMGSKFWIPLWVFLTLFGMFMTMFYTSLIVPLFNKLSPLEEGELRTAIESYCEKVGFKLTNLFVIDGSKRSSKSNAYFSGLGPKKKIVLFDTLIENQQTEEIVAVLAHEIGHYKLKHTLIGMILSFAQSGIMLYLMSLVIAHQLLGEALGVNQMSLHIGLICFTMLYSPLSTIFGILMNIVSRKNEFQADAYAATTYKAEKMIVALKKLSVDNLSNLYPHPAYVFVHHSHPPILKRIDSIKKVSMSS